MASTINNVEINHLKIDDVTLNGLDMGALLKGGTELSLSATVRGIECDQRQAIIKRMVDGVAATVKFTALQWTMQMWALILNQEESNTLDWGDMEELIPVPFSGNLKIGADTIALTGVVEVLPMLTLKAGGQADASTPFECPFVYDEATGLRLLRLVKS
jgi:hypothetical protein